MLRVLFSFGVQQSELCYFQDENCTLCCSSSRFDLLPQHQPTQHQVTFIQMNHHSNNIVLEISHFSVASLQVSLHVGMDPVVGC